SLEERLGRIGSVIERLGDEVQVGQHRRERIVDRVRQPNGEPPDAGRRLVGRLLGRGCVFLLGPDPPPILSGPSPVNSDYFEGAFERRVGAATFSSSSNQLSHSAIALSMSRFTR